MRGEHKLSEWLEEVESLVCQVAPVSTRDLMHFAGPEEVVQLKTRQLRRRKPSREAEDERQLNR